MYSQKFDFFYRFSKNPINIKFHENPFVGSRVFQCGQTDRHEEANSRFLQFNGYASEQSSEKSRMKAATYAVLFSVCTGYACRLTQTHTHTLSSDYQLQSTSMQT